MKLRPFLDIFPKLRNRIIRQVNGLPTFNMKAGTSDSEITFYLSNLRKTLSDNSRLKNFRRPYNYREILEHVDYELGQKYLDKILGQLGDRALDVISINLANDLFGNPVRYKFGNVGRISPTTLRYISTAVDIEREIGIKSQDAVVEIGVGYGGQAAVLRRMFGVSNYTFFDLPEVLELSARFLKEIGIDLEVSNGELFNVSRSFDVTISNYAFSELSRDLQESYLENVLLKSRRGYMIMNSGRTNVTGRSRGKLQLDELLTLLPNSRVKEEEPLTGPDNYVLLWGSNLI